MAAINLVLGLFLLLGLAEDKVTCNIVPSRKLCLQLCRMTSCIISPPDSDILQIQTGSLRFRIRQTQKGDCMEDCLQSGECFLVQAKDDNCSEGSSEKHTNLLLHPYHSRYNLPLMIYNPLRNKTTVVGTAFRGVVAIGFIPSLDKVLYVTSGSGVVYSVDYLAGVKNVWLRADAKAISVDMKRKRVFCDIRRSDNMCVFSATFDAKNKTLIYTRKQAHIFTDILSGEKELYICTDEGLVAITHNGKNTRLIQKGYTSAVAIDRSQNVLYYNNDLQLVSLELTTWRKSTYDMQQIYDLLVVRGVLYMSLSGKIATFDNGTAKLLEGVPHNMNIGLKYLMCEISLEISSHSSE